MRRKWFLLLTFATGAVVGLAAIGSADDDAKESKATADQAKTPLQKVMVKMDEQLKAIQKVSSSAARFKKSNKKELVPLAKELIKEGAETKKFTGPAEELKKPRKKWEEYSDQYVVVAEEMLKIVEHGDYQEVRKGLKNLDLSCSNCHGMFRPKSGGDDFGNP